LVVRLEIIDGRAIELTTVCYGSVVTASRYGIADCRPGRRSADDAACALVYRFDVHEPIGGREERRIMRSDEERPPVGVDL
jgi:hypothetical protein